MFADGQKHIFSYLIAPRIPPGRDQDWRYRKRKRKLKNKIEISFGVENQLVILWSENFAEKMLSASKNRELLIFQYARCRSVGSIPTNKQDLVITNDHESFLTKNVHKTKNKSGIVVGVENQFFVFRSDNFAEKKFSASKNRKLVIFPDVRCRRVALIGAKIERQTDVRSATSPPSRAQKSKRTELDPPPRRRPQDYRKEPS